MAPVVKNPPANARDVRGMSSIPGWARSLKEGKASHAIILALRIPMDTGAWPATIHRVAERHDWHGHTSTHISGYVWVVGLGWVLFFSMFFSTLYFCKQRLCYYYYRCQGFQSWQYYILWVRLKAPTVWVDAVLATTCCAVSKPRTLSQHSCLTFRLVGWLAQPHCRLQVSFRTVPASSFWGPG